MDIETLQGIANKLPGFTEDIKWGHDLCFNVGGKMFAVVGIDDNPANCSLKVSDEEFEEMSTRPGITPAKYLARHKWVHIADINTLSKKQWQHYLTQSYQLVKAKLPKKLQKEIDGK